MDATTFPLTFSYHLVFCIIAAIFFLFQFAHTRKVYELLLAIAIPSSLLIYLDRSNYTLFHAVGLLVLVLLVVAFVLAIIGNIKNKKQRKQEQKQEQEARSKAAEAPKQEQS